MLPSIEAGSQPRGKAKRLFLFLLDSVHNPCLLKILLTPKGPFFTIVNCDFGFGVYTCPESC